MKKKLMIDLDETICSPSYLEEVNKFMGTNYQYEDIETYFVEDIIPEKEREKFLDWLFDLEFGIYGLPKPTEVFFLNMPPEDAEMLMKDRANKFSHETTKDIHERNPKHIEESYNAACSLIDKYNWYEVKCVKDGKIRTIEDIHEEIYNEVLRKLK